MILTQAKLRVTRELIVFIILIVTIGFGFFKQTKVAGRSWEAMKASHEEPGERFVFLKGFLNQLPSGQSSQARISYLSDHTKEESKRAVIYFYYEAQYALAPVLIEYKKSVADYYLLDFTTIETLENFCKENGLSPILRQGNVALATNPSAG